MYLNVSDVASLYAQLNGEDVVETLISMETSSQRGLKLAIAAFLGGGIDSLSGSKESKTKKVTKRPENMIREIAASLRANGRLLTTLKEAKERACATSEPVWFEGRHEFSMPFNVSDCNDNNSVVFWSGDPPHHIEMAAGLNHFPSARNGLLGLSSHEALFFNRIRSAPHSFYVFGSVFRVGEGFQIKPMAIAM
ncbi:MAG: hypothetical protein ABL974_22755 [Prosthecobacter sp.]